VKHTGEQKARNILHYFLNFFEARLDAPRRSRTKRYTAVLKPKVLDPHFCAGK
jgi:hypothetical protein